MAFVPKYNGLLARLCLNSYLSNIFSEPKSNFLFNANFICKESVFCPLSPRLKPCAVTGCIPTAASPISAKRFATNRSAKTPTRGYE